MRQYIFLLSVLFLFLFMNACAPDESVVTVYTENNCATIQDVESTEIFKLNRDRFTMRVDEAPWPLYRGDIPKNSIKWWSEDESVAVVKNGNVSPVGTGVTYIYAEYNGVVHKCKVIVRE